MDMLEYREIVEYAAGWAMDFLHDSLDACNIPRSEADDVESIEKFMHDVAVELEKRRG